MILAFHDWTQGNKQRIIFISFVILFVIRLIAGYISTNPQNDIGPFFQYFYFIVSILLITTVIWASKNDLNRLSIDTYFLYTIVLSSVLLFFVFGFSLLGIIALICGIFVVKVSHLQKSEFHIQRNFSRVIFYVALGVIPIILSRLFIPEPYRIQNYYPELSVGIIFVIVSVVLWGVIFEEILFRGMLWVILREQKFSSKKIVFIQAGLFWLVHLDLIKSASFGLTVLAFGIWVGFLVLHSKSLIPSTAAHLVYNLTSNLL